MMYILRNMEECCKKYILCICWTSIIKFYNLPIYIYIYVYQHFDKVFGTKSSATLQRNLKSCRLHFLSWLVHLSTCNKMRYILFIQVFQHTPPPRMLLVHFWYRQQTRYSRTERRKHQVTVMISSANVYSAKKEKGSNKPFFFLSVINSVCNPWQIQSMYLRKWNGGWVFVLATGNT